MQRRADARGVVAGHQLTAAAAVQLRTPGVEQLEVIGQLGHRADRGARGAHRIGLVDRDRRGHPFNAVDLRPILAVENCRA